MALSQAQVEAGLQAFDEAIGRGLREVTIDGRNVVYASIDELLAARSHYVDLLGVFSGRSRQTLVVASKGF